MFGYISIVKFIMEFIVYFERFVIFVINCIGFIGIGMVWGIYIFVGIYKNNNNLINFVWVESSLILLCVC